MTARCGGTPVPGNVLVVQNVVLRLVEHVACC